MGAYARFLNEFGEEYARDNSDKSRQKPSKGTTRDLLSPTVASVPGTHAETDAELIPPSFHACVEHLLGPGQIPSERTFEKATVIWLEEARKRRLGN